MTQLITRYFDNAEKARSAKFELLHRRRFSQKIIHLYEKSEGLYDLLVAAGVEENTAKAYQKRVAAGGAVLVVFAGYKPLCVAQTTRDVTAAMGASELPNLNEEVFLKDELPQRSSILEDHPHMLTRPSDPDSTNFHMADWPIPLISRRKPYSETMFPRHTRMASFPIPLISRRKPFSGSIFPRHARMADLFLPLTIRRKPFSGSVFPQHARMANFILPLISRRKPYDATLIGRHTRMANWPFPLLINGQTGTNSLMPGGPRMAAFPIPLLSKRQPFDKSAFPRHARMANFPIPLISRRKPFAGSAIPRHARMADFFLPLVIKNSQDRSGGGKAGFSFSKLLGIPTLIRR